MSEHVKVIDGAVSIKPVLDWAYSMILKGIEGGAVAVVIRRHAAARNNEQNKKQWAMFTDIANQLEWHGQKMSKEDWKILLCHEWKPQTIIPAISGGFCVLNASTSKSSKVDFCDLIEIIYAFGSSRGVAWSEAALKEYANYKENQQ